MYIDSNNIIALGDQGGQEGKQFTRNFLGYPLTAYDHEIILYTKKGLQEKNWKDIGSGQSVLVIHPFAKEIEQMSMQLGVARLGYDLWYKYDEEQGICINLAKVDRTVEEFTIKTFGTGKQALVMPSYSTCFQKSAIVSFLFGLALAHGNWQVKDDTLLPVKLTIPCTSSLLGREELLKEMTDALHQFGVLHSIQIQTQGTYPIAQITLHDPYVLQLYKKWLDPIVKIKQISTYKHAQYVAGLVRDYLTSPSGVGGELIEISLLNYLAILPVD